MILESDKGQFEADTLDELIDKCAMFCFEYDTTFLEISSIDDMSLDDICKIDIEIEEFTKDLYKQYEEEKNVRR